MNDHSEVNPTADATGGVTITQAAALLKVHPNTIRRRIKDGSLPSTKVLTDNGIVYVIPRSALPATEEPPTPGNQVVNPTTALVPLEQVNSAVTEALVPLLEALGAKDAVIQQQAEELGAMRERAARVEALEAEVERLRRPWWRRGRR